MSNIASGRLRHRVTVEEQVESVDSSGFPFQDWKPIGRYWAAIEPMSVRELVASQQVQSEVRGRIVMRYTPRIIPSMRVVHGNTIYSILGIQRDPDSGLEWMTLAVSAGLQDKENPVNPP
jgi:SPP1 family predicted phage head-tail adaptor